MAEGSARLRLPFARFYLEYEAVVSDPNRRRLNLLSGMADISLTRADITETIGPIFCAIVNERNEILWPAVPPVYHRVDDFPDDELERIWNLRPTILCYYRRTDIFGLRVAGDVSVAIDAAVTDFCATRPRSGA
ncbi:hypothetical protein [Paracoccus pacificus]|uniref:Uncharacterized protein n=1 Tax=Paracoccus pacificus TaxID=1463598 RepID=A0ABW4R7T9_9RHOB